MSSVSRKNSRLLLQVPEVCLTQKASVACSRRTISLLRAASCLTAPTWRLSASTWPILDAALCSTTKSSSDSLMRSSVMNGRSGLHNFESRLAGNDLS